MEKKRKSETPRPQSNNIAFRITDEAELKLLLELGERDGVSQHEAAKRILLLTLRGMKVETETALTTRKEVTAQAERLIEALRLTLEVILVATGSMEPGEARKFIQEKLGGQK